MALQPTHYGFLAVGGGGRTHLAGLLVTDALGLPIEFVHTEPFAPTRLQRALIGDSLKRYLKQERVITSLLRLAEKQPALVAVDDEELLPMVPKRIPGVLVSAGTATGVRAGGELARTTDGDLVARAPGGRVLRLRLAGESSEALLAGAVRQLDLLEPLARVRAALTVVASDHKAA
ncbi:hypothetical protein Gocc_0422 [Gaiella occulta]|uniref:Uncharacterized protein n=1 Tax=Gaiella occulta TaxID=1002870 RepID=A0A7M2Z2M1_9ACTN|nr:hypothetical protein [Gaiella occulta]RDI76003.1 hypothetical protein Gocc_0422 [Gaiella occulta]